MGIPKRVRSLETGWEALVVYILFSDGSSSAKSFVTLAAAACMQKKDFTSFGQPTRLIVCANQMAVREPVQSICTVSSADLAVDI